MGHIVNLFLVLALLLNLAALGLSQVKAVIRIAAFQGVLLAALPLLLEGPFGWGALVALATAVMKGVVIPAMLFRAVRDVKIGREVDPLLGFIPSMFLGALGLGAGLLFARSMPSVTSQGSSLLVPAAVATLFAGGILLTTRQKAVMQVVGFLVLENGIYLFGLLLIHATPLLVEAGILLDLTVGVFVIGIIVDHIQRAFDTLDTRKLTVLRE